MAGLEQQQREHRTLLRPAEGKVTACPDGPHRAKDTQIERCSPGRRMRVQLHASIVHRPTSVDNCAGEPAVYGEQESAVE